MFTLLRKWIGINLDDLLLCGGVVGGLFLLVQIIIGCVMRFGRPETSITLSGILLPAAAAFLLLAVTLAHVMISFPMMLQMGQSRRWALGITLGAVGFETAFTIALTALLTWVESTFSPALWQWLSGARAVVLGDGLLSSPLPGSGGVLFIEDFSISWWLFLLIPLAGVAVGFVMGAAIQRFGNRATWIFWAFFVLVGLAPQAVPSYAVVQRQELLYSLPILGAGCLLAGLVWSVWSLLHAVVRS